MRTSVEDRATSIGIVLDAFAQHSQRPAIKHARGEWTYSELAARIYQMARVLRSQRLQRGDVIALMTGNRAQSLVLEYAANVLGCCTVFLYQDMAAPLLAEMLDAVDAAALVFAPGRNLDQAAAVAGGKPGLTVLALGPCAGFANVAALASAEATEPFPVEAKPGDLATIRLTGGSTGTPKGIPRDFRSPGHLSPPALRAWQDATFLLSSSIGRIGGMLAEITLAAGGRVVLLERFDAREVLAAVERERVTHLWMTPHQLYQLQDHPALESTDTACLRSIMLGGASSAPSRITRAVERFGPIITQGYGISEVGQVTMLTPPEHLRPELLTTVGRPLPGVGVSIRDTDGKSVDNGVTGEIWIRGFAMMTGYHKQPEQTAKALRDGWFHSSDLGFLDAEGYLTFVGRHREFFHCAAGRIYPSHIENVLLRHPHIQAAVVFDVTGFDAGQPMCAAIVPTPVKSVSADEVGRWVRSECGEAYAPDVVLVLDELPTTDGEKPDRSALRRMASSRA